MPKNKPDSSSNTFHKGVAPKKIFGQNFLINNGICEKIAAVSGINEEFGVIEIGPGMGALSKELCKRAKKVVAIEIDTELIPVLCENMKEYDNFEVINCDVLKANLSAVIAEKFGGLRVAVIGNLPYYITSPILMMLLEQRIPAEMIVAMVQKEAAIRFCAAEASRECGAVTLAIRYYSEPKILFDVSAGSFYPPPNVTSSVIKLEVRPSKLVPADEKRMFAIIKAAFSQRRKTAVNSISSGLKTDKAAVSEALQKLNLSATIRPEQMTLQNYADLCAII